MRPGRRRPDSTKGPFGAPFVSSEVRREGESAGRGGDETETDQQVA